MNSKPEESRSYSAFVQCFELKQNPILSYFAPAAITCIKYDINTLSIVNSNKVLEEVKKNSEKFGDKYKEYPIIQVNSLNGIPMVLKDCVATQLKVPLDTKFHITNFIM